MVIIMVAISKEASRHILIGRKPQNMDRPAETKQDLFSRFYEKLDLCQLRVDDVPDAGTEEYNEFMKALGFNAVERAQIESCLDEFSSACARCRGARAAEAAGAAAAGAAEAAGEPAAGASAAAGGE